MKASGYAALRFRGGNVVKLSAEVLTMAGELEPVEKLHKAKADAMHAEEIHQKWHKEADN